jgi:hypothetical protein
MSKGYIKLWRQILDSEMLKDHKLCVFWIWCILKASHKKHKVTVGRHEVQLLPGQFVFGRKKASEELNISEQSIRTIINFLKKTEKITIKPTNKFSIITIINWDIYQSENRKTTSKVTSNQPTPNHKQECKKYSETSKEVQYSKLLYGKIKERNPKYKTPDFTKWAKHIDRMVRLDGRTYNEVKAVIIWCQQDDFWQNNILSTGKLREQFDQLWMKMPKEKQTKKINRGNFD